MVAAVEGIPGLERLSESLVKVLTPMTERRALMDLLHGRWALLRRGKRSLAVAEFGDW